MNCSDRRTKTAGSRRPSTTVGCSLQDAPPTNRAARTVSTKQHDDASGAPERPDGRPGPPLGTPGELGACGAEVPLPKGNPTVGGAKVGAVLPLATAVDHSGLRPSSTEIHAGPIRMHRGPDRGSDDVGAWVPLRTHPTSTLSGQRGERMALSDEVISGVHRALGTNVRVGCTWASRFVAVAWQGSGRRIRRRCLRLFLRSLIAALHPEARRSHRSTASGQPVAGTREQRLSLPPWIGPFSGRRYAVSSS